MAGSRFGRNVPLDRTFPEPEPALLDPSPREVSRVLLGRPAGEIQRAEGANVLVAAWLQFVIRDWFSHGKSVTDDPWRVELADDDPWPQRPMRILRTRPDPTRPPAWHPPTSTPRPTGGTAPSCTATTRRSSGGCAPTSTASCASKPTACRPARPTRSATRPGFPGSGSGWR
jgi:hypothetical protein